MKKCAKICSVLNTPCDRKSCKLWIDYVQDLNCTDIAVEKHDSMSLREVAKRLNITHVRVKQIQDKALQKLSKIIK